MTLSWDDANLSAHTAKHFLGSPDEEWRDLVATPSVVQEWKEQAQQRGCSFETHAAGCREPKQCSAPVASAADPYRALTQAEWAFADSKGLFVEYLDRKTLHRVASGPRGIFVAAVRHDATSKAKTAFRDATRDHSNRIRWAVRKLKAHASLGLAGLSVRQLVELETLMLLPNAPIQDPHVRELWRALQVAPEKAAP